MLRVNFVTSIDGAVAIDGRSAGLSSEADLAVFRLLRRECDALMVGAGTYRSENYQPFLHRPAPHPRLVVVTGSVRVTIPEVPVRPVVLTTGDTDPGELAAVADVVRCADLRDGV